MTTPRPGVRSATRSVGYSTGWTNVCVGVPPILKTSSSLVVTSTAPLPPSNDPGVQRRTTEGAERPRCSSAATAGWAATPLSAVSRSEPVKTGCDRKRPDLKCRGPFRASQVARRAASRRMSSFEAGWSLLMVVSEPQAGVVAMPMVPLVHKWLVDLLEQRDASMKSASYVGFRHGMPAGGDAKGYPPDRVLLGRHLDEVE